MSEINKDQDGNTVDRSYMQLRSGNAEKIFYLSEKFEGRFTRKEAMNLFEVLGVKTCNDCFQILTNNKLVERVEKRHRPRATLYEVTEKGFRMATQFEKAVDRVNKFNKQKERE